MKIFSHILTFELNSIIRKKTWYITTIVIAILIVIATSIPTIKSLVSKNEEPSEMMEEKIIGVHLNTKDVSIENFSKYFEMKLKEVNSIDELKEKVSGDQFEFGIQINSSDGYKLFFKDKSMSTFSKTKMIDSALRSIQKEKYFKEKNMNYSEFYALENKIISRQEVVLGGDGVNNFLITYLLIFIVYFLVLFYGQMVSMSVAKEKSDRTMEILITSTTPTKLMYGKVIGGGLAGLLQFGILIGVTIISFMFNRANYPYFIKDAINFTPGLFVMFILFILLGYLLYLFIYAMLGATVSKIEELNQAVMPITLIMIASFIATTSTMQFPESMILKIASFIPFSSPLAMFTRISMYSVSFIEVLTSIIILILTTILFGFIAAKIYRSATLNYGNRMKLSKIFKLIFRKE